MEFHFNIIHSYKKKSSQRSTKYSRPIKPYPISSVLYMSYAGKMRIFRSFHDLKAYLGIYSVWLSKLLHYYALSCTLNSCNQGLPSSPNRIFWIYILRSQKRFSYAIPHINMQLYTFAIGVFYSFFNSFLLSSWSLLNLRCSLKLLSSVIYY